MVGGFPGGSARAASGHAAAAHREKWRTFDSRCGMSAWCQSLQLCAAAKSPYSITSSARASSVAGTVRPSAFAVLRLMTSSIFETCWTGRSAGFSPLRIRPT